MRKRSMVCLIPRTRLLRSQAGSLSPCFNVAGPENVKITINTLTEGEIFDQGPVCANEDTGYIFVQSNCTQMADISVTFQQSTYHGPICLDLNGHHLSGTLFWPSWLWVHSFMIVTLYPWLAEWLAWSTLHLHLHHEKVRKGSNSRESSTPLCDSHSITFAYCLLAAEVAQEAKAEQCCFHVRKIHASVGWAIAVIVVAATIVAVIASWMICSCCCGYNCCCSY